MLLGMYTLDQLTDAGVDLPDLLADLVERRNRLRAVVAADPGTPTPPPVDADDAAVLAYMVAKARADLHGPRAEAAATTLAGMNAGGGLGPVSRLVLGTGGTYPEARWPLVDALATRAAALVQAALPTAKAMGSVAMRAPEVSIDDDADVIAAFRDYDRSLDAAWATVTDVYRKVAVVGSYVDRLWDNPEGRDPRACVDGTTYPALLAVAYEVALGGRFRLATKDSPATDEPPATAPRSKFVGGGQAPTPGYMAV